MLKTQGVISATRRTCQQSTASLTRFIESLNNHIDSGQLDIPGFPDVVVRLSHALNDSNVEIADIVSLVTSEPGLVSRLIRIADSA